MEDFNIVKYNFGTENTHWVYIPENVNKDTEIIYVAFNDKRSKDYNNKWQAMEEGILNYGEDKIIVYPENPDLNPGHGNYQIEANKVFNAIKEDYNLETNQFINVGHSAGAGWSLKNLTVYLKENPNVERQTLFLVDSHLEKAMTDEEMQLIAENNTLIISYNQKYRRNYEIEKIAKRTGLPILYVNDPDIPEKTNLTEYYHNVVAENFFTKGLYNSLTDFSQGKGDLPDGFTYEMYDPKTDQTYYITADEAAVIFEVNTYESMVKRLSLLNEFTLDDLNIKSEKNVLLNHLNNIIVNIKNSNFVQNGTPSVSFSSTTQVPSAIPGVVSSFYSTTATLALKIVKEIQQFAKIGESIENQDEGLANEATELGNVVTQITAGTATTLAQTQIKQEETESEQAELKKEEQTDSKKDESENQEQTDSKKDESENQEQTDSKKDESEKQEQTDSKKDESSNTETQTTDNNVSQQGETKKETYTNNYTNNQTSNQNNTSHNNTTSSNANESSNKETNSLDAFPDYKEVYSDDSKIVYEYNDECRIIVHKEGNDVTGIEHYYKFDNENLADKALATLSKKYQTNNNIENIIQKDNYVKVVFKKELYENMSLNDIRNQYKDLSEIIKI